MIIKKAAPTAVAVEAVFFDCMFFHRKQIGPASLLDNFDAEVVEADRLHKAVFAEDGDGLPLELPDVRGKPDRYGEVHVLADFLQRGEHAIGAGHAVVLLAGNTVPNDTSVLINCTTHTKHRILLCNVN